MLYPHGMTFLTLCMFLTAIHLDAFKSYFISETFPDSPITLVWMRYLSSVLPTGPALTVEIAGAFPIVCSAWNLSK